MQMDLYTVKLHLSIYKWQNIKEYYIKTQLHYQSGTTRCESNYSYYSVKVTREFWPRSKFWSYSVTVTWNLWSRFYTTHIIFTDVGIINSYRPLWKLSNGIKHMAETPLVYEAHPGLYIPHVIYYTNPAASCQPWTTCCFYPKSVICYSVEVIDGRNFIVTFTECCTWLLNRSGSL